MAALPFTAGPRPSCGATIPRSEAVNGAAHGACIGPTAGRCSTTSARWRSPSKRAGRCGVWRPSRKGPTARACGFSPYPTPLRDASGRLVGAINLLMDVAEQHDAELESARLAAIIVSSDDAIISKTIDGRITSWNAGATRIFGYEASEMIGESILRIIPPELHGEEREILARLQRGERIDHYGTVRVAKDGRRVDISLTVSPLRDRSGKVVGASKVGRDITDRKRAEK